MSRKDKDFSREIIPDPRFGSATLSKFINKVMIKGKKSTAQGIVYEALDILAQNVKEDPVVAFEKAMKNVIPLMEVRSRRVGGSTYQVPVEVKLSRAYALAMRWVIEYSRKQKGQSMALKLAQELTAAHKKEGSSIKRREDTHKMADANKAFAHFRW